MDPKANLQEQERILRSARPDLERLGELVAALDDWFAGGGFVPDGWSPQTLRVQRSEAVRFLRDRHEGVGEF